MWVRVEGRDPDELVVFTHLSEGGPVEVARHLRAEPGSPRIIDAHFPPAPAGSLHRIPRARTVEEAAFLDSGEGSRLWLSEAAAAGTTKLPVKMGQPSALTKLFDPGRGRLGPGA